MDDGGDHEVVPVGGGGAEDGFLEMERTVKKKRGRERRALVLLLYQVRHHRDADTTGSAGSHGFSLRVAERAGGEGVLESVFSR